MALGDGPVAIDPVAIGPVAIGPVAIGPGPAIFGTGPGMDPGLSVCFVSLSLVDFISCAFFVWRAMNDMAHNAPINMRPMKKNGKRTINQAIFLPYLNWQI